MYEDRNSLLENSAFNPSTSCIQQEHIETQSTNYRNVGGITEIKPAKLWQIFAGFSATLSALSAGIVLGWTSPIFDYLTQGKYNGIVIDHNQMGWIGSFATLGAMAMCIPTGFICDFVGRKVTLLLLIIPFALGWALILWARSLLALYFGRLITGMAVGACCVAAPLYNGEIAHQSVKGLLGSFFQLMMVTGIFVAYVVGKFFSSYQFTIFCAILPFVFLLMFAFHPESPNYLIKKGKFDEAKKCLIRLRGANYDVDAELVHIEGSLKESSQSTGSLRHTFFRRSVKKAILISLSLMFFQQFSGINAVILYSSDIFKSTGISLDPNVATIMVGGFQALATFCSSLIIDKLGRKYLLLVSVSLVTITTMLLAIYFSLKLRLHLDADELKDVSFIPIGALCLFVIAFSLGLGPIPWMISSEILPPEICSIVSSISATFNWFLAFVLTKTYLQVCHLVGEDTTFYAFAVVSLVGTFFVITIVPETRGKSVEEIQDELVQ